MQRAVEVAVEVFRLEKILRSRTLQDFPSSQQSGAVRERFSHAGAPLNVGVQDICIGYGPLLAFRSKRSYGIHDHLRVL